VPQPLRRPLRASSDRRILAAGSIHDQCDAWPRGSSAYTTGMSPPPGQMTTTDTEMIISVCRCHLEEQMLELVAVELGGGLAVKTQAPRLKFGVVREVMA
jgi:hypothetical protein